jgi:cell division protein FtsB
LIILLVSLQYRLWAGAGSLPELWRMQQEVQTQKQENARLGDRNRVLQAEVDDLKHGVAAIEERARTDLGMIKKGETFYQIVNNSHD